MPALQAEFLKIKPLVNLLITRIAAQIKSMSLEEIESLFKIDPPITLEEATKYVNFRAFVHSSM